MHCEDCGAPAFDTLTDLPLLLYRRYCQRCLYGLRLTDIPPDHPDDEDDDYDVAPAEDHS